MQNIITKFVLFFVLSIDWSAEVRTVSFHWKCGYLLRIRKNVYFVSCTRALEAQLYAIDHRKCDTQTDSLSFEISHQMLTAHQRTRYDDALCRAQVQRVHLIGPLTNSYEIRNIVIRSEPIR